MWEKKRPVHKFLKLRTNWLKLALILAMVVIAVRLFSVQILQHSYYERQAAEQQTLQTTIVANRGEIYMMDREDPVVVAMNTKVWTVIMDPQVAKLDRENVEAKITEYAKDYLVASWDDIFSSDSARYFVVARNVPLSAAQKIQDAELSGVWMQGTTKRTYPEGQLGAQLLGFVNDDGVGQYGVEGSLNEDLAGKNGILKTVKDVNNIPLTIGSDNIRVPAEDGKNIVLTVDRNIQNQTEKALKEVTKNFGVANATAVVMNPQTGEILALAGTPSYDPANFGNVKNAEVYQTDATLGLYEPASVCKTFAFAAAINEGKMTPETTYYNTDKTVIDGWTINNASRGHTGNISMQTALSWSLNTGSVQALRLLGGDPNRITDKGKQMLFDYYTKKFRLGQFTGVELLESDGLVYKPELVSDVTYANMTFGQGLALTVLQVAAGYASILNGGDYYAPTVVAGEMKNGKFIQKNVAEPDSGVISKDTSKTMRKMLHEARKLYGDVGKYDKGAYVGGKTGTAQTVDAKTGAYIEAEKGQTVGSYVGFGAKTENDIPEYLIAVKIWENGKTMDGGTNAKPIFDRISQYMIKYLHWDVI